MRQVLRIGFSVWLGGLIVAEPWWEGKRMPVVWSVSLFVATLLLSLWTTRTVPKPGSVITPSALRWSGLCFLQRIVHGRWVKEIAWGETLGSAVTLAAVALTISMLLDAWPPPRERRLPESGD
jgi:hypothetical protein